MSCIPDRHGSPMTQLSHELCVTHGSSAMLRSCGEAACDPFQTSPDSCANPRKRSACRQARRIMRIKLSSVLQLAANDLDPHGSRPRASAQPPIGLSAQRPAPCEQARCLVGL